MVGTDKEPGRAGRWRDRLSRKALGVGLIVASILALAFPFAAGAWSLQFLSVFPFAVGLIDLYTAAVTPSQRGRLSSYVTGFAAIGAALVLYVSPSLVVSGVLSLLLVFLVVDGASKLIAGFSKNTAAKSRIATITNGLSSWGLALIGWWLWQTINVDVAVGVAVAGYTAAAGWRLLVAPSSFPVGDKERDAGTHPDSNLGLGGHKIFGEANAAYNATIASVRRAELYWLLVAGLVLFVIHLSRMQSADTWLGLISPVVATAGDLLMAIAFGGLLILPLRLCWRRLTRPIERRAWSLRLSGHDLEMDSVPRRLLHAWTDSRFSFSASLRDARLSLHLAAGLLTRFGLPVAVLFAAVNPIWGSNWYFNTESWASAFYQKVTELRVDKWRAGMVDAVRTAYGENQENLFRVAPAGIDDQDFSFIVIGDTGEGDGSQYSLVERYLELGRRDDIKFLIVSSDIIYPAGAMSDYESNFYLPFKGFTKPIYAIPGNHDWFDALEGFNANFLEPKAARAAIAARAKADLHLTSTDTDRIDRLLGRAERLRELYRLQIAKQRAPFFEIQTRDFAIIAIDTGIRRTLDDRQLAWVTAALDRARGKFTMAIVGHPKFAAGKDTSEGDDKFAALYEMLETAGVRVLMAGDTHDFEYYRREAKDGTVRHHFVNGGGGAYLSIGGALAWPKSIPAKEWAFYPGSKAIRAKLDAETPIWKWPVWYWVKRFGAWPSSIETLSSIFDFNGAPFYQSFMEIRVERSRRRVVFALQGVNGPVRWRDLETSADGSTHRQLDNPVEFVVPMISSGH